MCGPPSSTILQRAGHPQVQSVYWLLHYTSYDEPRILGRPIEHDPPVINNSPKKMKKKPVRANVTTCLTCSYLRQYKYRLYPFFLVGFSSARILTVPIPPLLSPAMFSFKLKSRFSPFAKVRNSSFPPTRNSSAHMSIPKRTRHSVDPAADSSIPSDNSSIHTAKTLVSLQVSTAPRETWRN